ncbi:MAG: 3'(2'),5'-bisphosphate nucleotidase CysQ [Pseudomonadota bacterium]
MQVEVNDKLLQSLLPQVIDIAWQAGKEILETAEKCININCKKDNTPVTNADLAANKLIVTCLSRLEGNFAIISEESESIAYSQRKLWQTYWLVDPLDGTREFINNNGEYSVNIALIHKHKAILGVIYAPVHGLTYYAYHGLGAYKIDGLNKVQSIHVQTKRRNPIIVTCGNNQPGKDYEDFIKRLGEVEFLAMGSSIKSCLVADGSADIYARLGPTSEWDTAAAQCIVEEAGGYILDSNMKTLYYNTKDSLLNPNFLVFGDKKEDWGKYLSD